ncbi:MAG TPA: Dabb family protein [Mycobacterium sp.]|nr:Dabb family protein [Mycobacterium sp.]
MYNWLSVITFPQTLDDADRTATAAKLQALLQELPRVRSTMAMPSPADPFRLNGGDLVCRTVFESRGDYQKAVDSQQGQQVKALLNDQSTAAALNEVGYEGGLSGGAVTSPTIYRVALFCANIEPTRDRLEQFRTETSLMPSYIKTIQRWQLSTLSSQDTARGLHHWTHVWEQEYAELDGLTGTYLFHPDHWAHVDRWFDPEYPEFLVDPVLVNTFCPITTSVILT